MGSFEQHYSDYTIVYPVTSLFVGAAVYLLTRSGLVMLASVLAGYGFLIIGLLIPDIDSTQSVVHRIFDRLVLGTIACLAVYWLVTSDVGATLGIGLTVDVGVQDVPDALMLVVLLTLVLVWWGYTTPHRGIPHRLQWALCVAVLIGLGIWFGLSDLGVGVRFALGGSVAIHFLVGVITHLDRDGELFGDELQLWNTGKD